MHRVANLFLANPSEAFTPATTGKFVWECLSVWNLQTNHLAGSFFWIYFESFIESTAPTFRQYPQSSEIISNFSTNLPRRLSNNIHCLLFQADLIKSRLVRCPKLKRKWAPRDIFQLTLQNDILMFLNVFNVLISKRVFLWNKSRFHLL